VEAVAPSVAATAVTAENNSAGGGVNDSSGSGWFW
jgi:hypothetical protein